MCATERLEVAYLALAEALSLTPLVIDSTTPGAAGITAEYRFEITAASFFPLHSFAPAVSMSGGRHVS